MKVLIYSSEELYKNSGFEGRAEAELIAYRLDEYWYKIVKDIHDIMASNKVRFGELSREIRIFERNLDNDILSKA